MQIRWKVSPTPASPAPSGQEKRDKGRQNPRRRRRSTATATSPTKKRKIKRRRWSRMFSVPGCWRFMRSKSHRPWKWNGRVERATTLLYEERLSVISIKRFSVSAAFFSCTKIGDVVETSFKNFGNTRIGVFPRNSNKDGGRSEKIGIDVFDFTKITRWISEQLLSFSSVYKNYRYRRNVV